MKAFNKRRKPKHATIINFIWYGKKCCFLSSSKPQSRVDKGVTLDKLPATVVLKRYVSGWIFKSQVTNEVFSDVPRFKKATRKVEINK